MKTNNIAVILIISTWLSIFSLIMYTRPKILDSSIEYFISFVVMLIINIGFVYIAYTGGKNGS